MQKRLQCLVLLVLCVTSSGCSDGATATNTTSGTDPNAPAWCDVLPILQDKCQRCHQEPTENGAPFPLLTYQDTQVVDRRVRAIQTVVQSGFMPPTNFNLDPPVEPLSCEEKRTLLAWLDADAPPPKDASCQDSSPKLLACD